MNENMTAGGRLDFALIREKLRESRGPEFWRSLEELAGTEEFERFLQSEFPSLLPSVGDPFSRRTVLKLMGASLGLAGLTACTKPPGEKIVPYVRAPEDFIPGKPLYYATSMPLGGYATGLLAESHLGRPTKIEGNPQHPASLGAADIFAQASVLTLYDPDRSQAILHNGRISSWPSFINAVNIAREQQGSRRGAGLRILTETVTSPTLAAQIASLMAEFPEARWHQYEPAGRDSARAGALKAFGEYVNTVYRVDKADVILSLDSDFLTHGPGHLRYARDWSVRRNGQAGRTAMNRLYAVECTPGSTGAVADHRLSVRPSEIEALARAAAGGAGLPVDVPNGPWKGNRWIDALVRDLRMHRGASLVIPGEFQPPSVHVLAHALNEALGNVGITVYYTDPAEASPADQTRSMIELVEDMRAGRVDVLVILDANPMYAAPADLDFAEHFGKVPLRIHMGLNLDETARLSNWHVPGAHYLEAWGDARAYDGTASVIQPLIAPLYGGKSAHEVLSVLLGKPGVSGYDAVWSHWQARNPGAAFEEFWQVSLHDGLIAGSTLAAKSVSIRADALAAMRPAARPVRGMELVFRPDPSVFDGRFANNGWLQELPKPLTKITWENAALISPAAAERDGLSSRDVVEVEFRGRRVRAPVWIMPGQPDQVVTIHLGYGRAHAGKVGSSLGFNACALRPADAPWHAEGVRLRKVDGGSMLACTQHHHSMENRHLVQVGTVEEFEKNPRFAKEMAEEPHGDLTLYPGWDYTKGYSWGMVVNLGSCIGCNACVVACQAENNIPVAGKMQVNMGREMHWIRVDRYYSGRPDDPSTHFQPVMCMHCENAPCEVVCPVQATAHSAEGLNQMVYNRCVGTRYCSNNCPYKVRRFNFLQYTDWETASLKPLRNPDVTVRGRGVMEKCTFCVQRINAAKIDAELEDREVRDGEIVTACEAACPTQAITFGNLNEKGSRVVRAKASPLDYGLLADLNTRPRLTYWARLTNPNPELAVEKSDES